MNTKTLFDLPFPFGPPQGAESAGTPDAQRDLKRHFRTQLAMITGGLAPEDYANAWMDWYLRLSSAPEVQSKLLQSAMQRAADNIQFGLQAAAGAPLSPRPEDAAFAAPGWQQWPFNVYARAWSNWAAWMQEAAASAPGVDRKNAALVNFATQHAIHATSPAHYLPTNPELLERTRAESGQNLVRGLQHWLDDAQRMLGKRKPAGAEAFRVGEQLAATPGKVVLRNELIELIQYAPATDTVFAEPVLIAPAWIMKYYILDLSPHNSLVKYLTDQGHTVFMISWKNPTAADRHFGMDDYVRLGLLDALDAVTAIVPKRRIHAVGYCIGGTLLSIAAAALARDGDQRIATVTLLAAQTDFSEPGELSLFISPKQLETLEAMMHKAGVLESEKMGGAFTLLRARDLLWQPAIDNYVKGERTKLNDLMAWNADGTRMPWRMHTEYLERLYLKNELAGGTFTVAGKPVDLAAIRVPMFVVGTETDHVAPWKSVYKVRGLTRSSDYTFLLTSGGHNAGIVSGPAHPKRRHRVRTWSDATTAPTPEAWHAEVPVEHGSWWPVWQRWLAAQSSARRVAPPALGNARAGCPASEDAPGRYVHG
jgi:polyhydroxyalkanoate synthase